MKTLGCVQSCYIPWRGYFDIIRNSDIFVVHDDIQYTKQDWRNRNRIKTANGTIWLTVPVRKNTTCGAIGQVVVDNDRRWGVEHWRKLEAWYAMAPYFKDFGSQFQKILLARWENLSALNVHLIHTICDILDIRTPIQMSGVMGLCGQKTDRLIAMCQAVGATRYLSGPSACAYIEPQKFLAHGIELTYMKYDYAAYPQMYGQFIGEVSIVDLIFNCGYESRTYLRSQK